MWKAKTMQNFDNALVKFAKGYKDDKAIVAKLTEKSKNRIKIYAVGTKHEAFIGAW